MSWHANARDRRGRSWGASRFGRTPVRRDRRCRRDFEGDRDSHSRAAVGTRTDLSVTSDLDGARAQLPESEAHRLFGIEADAVVNDLNSGIVLCEREHHADVVGLGVLAGVRQSLLGRTQQDDLSVVREPDGVTFDLEVSGEAETGAEVIAHPANGVGERCPL